MEKAWWEEMKKQGSEGKEKYIIYSEEHFSKPDKY